MFSKQEITTVIADQPGLAAVNSSTLSGSYLLNAKYGDEHLEASFDIKVVSCGPDELPKLFETGGKTDQIVAKWNLPGPEEVHQNISDGSACVCTLPAEREYHPAGAPLSNYMERLAQPYLYALAYADKYGRWPWKDFSHGTPGLFEFYADKRGQQLDLEALEKVIAMMRRDSEWKRWHKQLRKPNSESSCPCGSGKSFGRCHGEAYQGIEVLNQQILKQGINLQKLISQSS